MASKLPLKIFDWKQKLTKWSIRINKTIKHRILSKSRNALIISSTQLSQSQQFINNQSSTQKSTTQNKNQLQNKLTFENKLKNTLKKTWQIYQLNINKHNLNTQHQQLQTKLTGKQYDAIIVIPQTNRQLKGFYDIQQEQFVTNTQVYNKSLMKNIFAYRLAHKYLATSGVLIFSNSQADFAKVQNKNGVQLVKQPALKNVLDAQVSYLAVTVGDRDYTDLNSWSVVGLSQEFIKSQNQDFVVEMYSRWADGRNLPMPGSFALFKMKEQGKKSPFVQYL